MTSALVSLMGQARIYVLLGRERLLPPWLAHIHPDRKTPVNATLLTALSAGRCLLGQTSSNLAKHTEEGGVSALTQSLEYLALMEHCAGMTRSI